MDVLRSLRTLLFLSLSACWGLPISAWAQVRTEMQMQGESFLSPAFDAAPATSYQFLGAHLRNEKRVEEGLEIDLKGAFAFDAPLMSYMNIRELNQRTKIGDRQSFSVGRRHEEWSELDRRWNFGLVEPLFRWNPLSPERQGLTGLFWDVEDGILKLGLFGSFLFLPDQGPSFALDEKGQFVPGNPWFRSPPKSIRVLSEASAIEYQFQRPRETDIVFQTSYGLRFEVGDETGPFMRGAFFYKPMNQLALGYDGVLDIAKDKGVVEILPQVAFHSLGSIDLMHRSENLRFGLSMAVDRPSNNLKFDERWTQPVYSNATLVSPFLDWKITGNWVFRLQHLQVDGGEVTEKGPLASPDRASISSRYPYQQISEASLETQTRLYRSRVWMKGAYALSAKNEFRRVQWQGRVDFAKDWSVLGELQLIQAEELTKENRNDLAEFNNHDRVSMGVGYVF